jgi:hypothetical protein
MEGSEVEALARLTRRDVIPDPEFGRAMDSFVLDLEVGVSTNDATQVSPGSA